MCISNCSYLVSSRISGCVLGMCCVCTHRLVITTNSQEAFILRNYAQYLDVSFWEVFISKIYIKDESSRSMSLKSFLLKNFFLKQKKIK